MKEIFSINYIICISSSRNLFLHKISASFKRFRYAKQNQKNQKFMSSCFKKEGKLRFEVKLLMGLFLVFNS